MPAGTNRIAQITSVSGIYSEKRVLDILDQAQIYLVGKNVTQRNQTVERIENFGRFHVVHPFQELLSVDLRSEQTDRFQNRDFAAVQFDLASHAQLSAEIRALSSRLSRQPRRGILLQPLPKRIEMIAYFAFDVRQFFRHESSCLRPALCEHVILDFGLGAGAADRDSGSIRQFED
jgi:hypothetical protein